MFPCHATHFSSGAGRTGAFIALYVMLDRLTRVNTVDICNYVQYMRKQRISMVSNEVGHIWSIIVGTLIEHCLFLD